MLKINSIRDFSYVKNFFTILITVYIILIFTKALFYFYLNEYFATYTISTILYTIFWGYKFDIAMGAIVALLSTFFDFNKKLFASVGTFFIVSIFLVQIGDMIYFNESSRHIGYEIEDIFVDTKSLLLTALGQHTLLIIFTAFCIILLSYFSYKFFVNFKKVPLDKTYILKKIVLIVMTIFLARGMTWEIPLHPWQSNQISDEKLSILTLNASYNLTYVLLNMHKKIEQKKVINLDKKALKISLNRLYKDKNSINSIPKLNKPNVIFFFLESWSGVNMKRYGYAKETTPFFDTFLKKCVRPKAMIAGGHRTSEGMFATLSSFQNPLGRSVAKSNLQNQEYHSIIKILRDKASYSSAFFQGSNKETSGVGSFAQTLGFEKSYGRSDVKKEHYERNSWGVHDPDLYNFVLDTVEVMKKPFVVGINGVTTHDDQIPKEIKSIMFSKNSSQNRLLNALHFSDIALKEFIKKIEKKYPNTLLVLFADHCGRVKGSAFENYLIPFGLYHKDLTPKYYDTYFSQRDIAPTVYDLIFGDYSKDNIPFVGKSIFRNNKFYADYYHNGILAIVKNQKIAEINIVTKKLKCYTIKNFKDKKRVCTNKDQENIKDILNFTQYSQNLLFRGKTNNFWKIKND